MVYQPSNGYGWRFKQQKYGYKDQSFHGDETGTDINGMNPKKPQKLNPPNSSEDSPNSICCCWLRSPGETSQNITGRVTFGGAIIVICRHIQ
jgi:hypothetical protein